MFLFFHSKKYLRQNLFVFLLFSILNFNVNAQASWCERETSVPAPTIKLIGILADQLVDSTPNAIVSIKTEGLLPGQGLHDTSQNAKLDFSKTLTLAYGWHIHHKVQYLHGARNFLIKWAETYKPNFNPIDETGFTQLFEAYAVVKPDLSPNDQNIINTWLLDFYKGYLLVLKQQVINNKIEKTNWQSHRIKIVTAAAAAMGDLTLLNKIEPYFHTQISANILPDGSTVDFHKRDSLNYAVYSLKPLIESALFSRIQGNNWLSVDSISSYSLMKSLDWLQPYIIGSKTHIEYKNTTVRFDRLRAEAGVKGHQYADWDAINARDLLWLASYINIKYLSLAQALSPKSSAFLELCHTTLTQYPSKN